MNFNMNTFRSALEGCAVERIKQSNSNEGEVYILKCLIDDVPSDKIDFSKFSLEEVVSAIELIECGYSSHDDCYKFDEQHPLSVAKKYSDLEVNLTRMFGNIASKRRRNLRKFI